MALFGLPRAAFGIAWWTDARVGFAVVSPGNQTIALAVRLLRQAGAGDPALIRAVQSATVLPIAR